MASYTPEFGKASLPSNIFGIGAEETVRRGRILEDEEANVLVLERLLQRGGFENFLTTMKSPDALDMFRGFRPDIVLLDLHMPELDGFAVLQQLQAETPTGEFLPIVILTADATTPTRRRALAAGATDFLTKPLDHVEVLLRIRNLLEARSWHLQLQKHSQTLEDQVSIRTSELERALTDLKTAQQQLVQRERLAALGTMAGGIAHDFNNALTMIIGFGEILLRGSEKGLTKEAARAPLRAILTAAEDAAHIVHRLREFHSPDRTDEQRVPVNLSTLAEQALTLTKPRWSGNSGACRVEVQRELGNVPEIAGSPAELREVLTNLIFNAVDAMPNGGTLTFKSWATNDAVVLQISDTGTGMTEEVRRRCLEPFFTTKGARGTGLGLAMVFGIIDRHEAAMEIDSELGKGTTFTLRFPRKLAPVEHEPGSDGKFDRLLHVLIADDQPFICDVVAEYLKQDGHTAEAASDGRQALTMFRAGRFDLVITDQAMPEMDGHDVAREIKKLSPETPVVLLTGFGDTPETSTGGADFVLAKPMSHIDVRRAVATVISAKSTADHHFG